MFVTQIHMHMLCICDPVWETGLITYLKVSRNTGFKYSVCCSSPMFETTYMCQIFTHFIPLPSRASTVEVANI